MLHQQRAFCVHISACSTPVLRQLHAREQHPVILKGESGSIDCHAGVVISYKFPCALMFCGWDEFTPGMLTLVSCFRHSCFPAFFLAKKTNNSNKLALIESIALQEFDSSFRWCSLCRKIFDGTDCIFCVNELPEMPSLKCTQPFS